jgi:hypothetical protein
MSEEATEQTPSARCPICGGEAEAGCIYGKDSLFGMRWREGEPSLWGNIVTGLLGGDPVGEVDLLRGTYLKGIRCKHCNRIVLQL